MKESEKLLDLIGQIDDRLVEEAADAGAARTDIIIRDGKKRQKKAAFYRWQGALAACAVMAVCIGVFGLLERSGMLSAPFETDSSRAAGENKEAAMDGAAAEIATIEGAAIEKAVAEEQELQDTVLDAADGEPEAFVESSAAEQGKEAPQDLQSTESPDRSISSDASLTTKENIGAEEMSISENVVITVTESSAESVTFTVKYNGSGTISFGEVYEIEQFTDGTWQTVQPKAEVCWKEPEYMIEESETFEQTVNFGRIYGALMPGQYRLVKNYERTEGKEPGGKETYPMYVEFMILE